MTDFPNGTGGEDPSSSETPPHNNDLTHLDHVDNPLDHEIDAHSGPDHSSHQDFPPNPEYVDAGNPGNSASTEASLDMSDGQLSSLIEVDDYFEPSAIEMVSSALESYPLPDQSTVERILAAVMDRRSPRHQ